MESMLRPIDHLVLPVDSLASARARYERLGFQVQADRQHPFGTANCCIMFANGTYLEPLAVGDREAVETAISGRNLFVRRQDAYRFRHGEGFAMLALKSADAVADHRKFGELGYGSGEVFEFERAGTDADGGETKIGVRLAHAEEHRSPDCLLFACEHLTPEALWTAQGTQHANGCRGVTAIFLSETNPADFQYYLEALTGQRDIRASSSGIEADTGGGTVSVLTPYALRAMFEIDAEHAVRGLQLRGFSAAVNDLGRLCGHLDGNGVDYRRHGPRIVVDTAPGQGAFIIFEEASP